MHRAGGYGGVLGNRAVVVLEHLLGPQVLCEEVALVTSIPPSQQHACIQMGLG